MVSGEVVGETGFRMYVTPGPDELVEAVLSPAVDRPNLRLTSLTQTLSLSPTTWTGLIGLSKPVHSRSKKTMFGLPLLCLP